MESSLDLLPRAQTRFQLATGASRLMSKSQEREKKKSLKLVHGAKCVSGWCGVPDADMARLILGGGQRGEDGRGRGGS